MTMDVNMIDNQTTDSQSIDSRNKEETVPAETADGLFNQEGTADIEQDEKASEDAAGSEPVAASGDIAEAAALQETVEDIAVVEEERRRTEAAADPVPSDMDNELASDDAGNTHVVPVSLPIEETQSDTDAPSPDGAVHEELKAVKEELAAVKERLERLEKGPSAPSGNGADIADSVMINPPVERRQESSIIAEARNREARGLAQDLQALTGYQQDLEYWAEAATVLQLSVQETIEVSKEALAAAVLAKDALPPPLPEKLHGRHQGLELVGKMLTRLPDKVLPLAECPPIETTLKAFTEQDWLQLIQDDAAGRKIEPKLRNLETERYQQLTQARDLSIGQRKRVLGFVEKQILPILDALDEGERLSRPFLDTDDGQDAEDGPPDPDVNLADWFSTYAKLRSHLLSVAAKMNVLPMTVHIGDMIDYARHEPFDVVPDPNLPTEAIKEETRKGYECRLPDNQAPIVLRAAQVVVVKN